MHKIFLIEIQRA